jgi:tryptophanyl-tRNA synthetase
MIRQVPAHSELMWILSTTASMGYLSRMTQWKVSGKTFPLYGPESYNLPEQAFIT